MVKNWNRIKKIGYSMIGKEIKIETGNLVYTLGDPAECVYFIL